MKFRYLTFLYILFSFCTNGQTNKINNPSGTYTMITNAKVKNGDTYGYFGAIQIRLLERSKIAISFYVNKGAPGYNSGSFIDTLALKNNVAIYKNSDDSTCTITFKFSKKGIRVTEQTANYNFGCGFGHAVVANGFYKKTSSKIPIIKDQAAE